MKQRILRIVILALASFGLFAVSAPVHASNLFTIPTYVIDYTLDRNKDNHSVLYVKETITADFTLSGTNHGIERALPSSYDGRSLKMSSLKVTDLNGDKLQHSTHTDDDDNTVIRIGDPDEYVLGLETYIIEYTLSDVTKYFSDVDRDEWYWNTNGTNWKVSIESLTVNITLDESLADALIEPPVCYYGIEGSTNRCSLARTSEGQYTVTKQNLFVGSNITVAYGFPENTFAGYEYTPLEWLGKMFNAFILIKAILAVAAFNIFSIMYSRRKDRKSERKPTPTQYIPPKEASVLASGLLVGAKGSGFTAQLLDWAVRHYIDIYETKPKGLFTKADYDIEIKKDVNKLKEEEKELLRDMFDGSLPAVGARLSLKSLSGNLKFVNNTRDNQKKLTKSLEKDYQLREKNSAKAKFITVWGVSLIVLGLITFSIPFLALSVFILAIYKPIFRPFTDKGLALARYLDGYKLYIKAAEKDRLVMLQGPDTAEKIGRTIDLNKPAELIKLYERSLPYAVLFKVEKKWSEQLSHLYQQANHNPSWYHSSGAFQYAGFAAAMSTFSSASTSYGASGGANSSGSGGGGSSGGGGGGGGGGGW